MRVAYNLFTQRPKGELADFQALDGRRRSPATAMRCTATTAPAEMLVYSAADFEDFLEPRPELPADDGERALPRRAAAGGEALAVPHACDLRPDDRARTSTVFERVNREVPLDGLHWFIDHAETITPRSIERIAALGGGIAIQHRMAYPG